ncbi:MAG: hypothetical protein Q9185_001435 [Variospora sp. 1 TL-2023]
MIYPPLSLTILSSTIILSLLTFTLAASSPPNTTVTWLYPPPSSPAALIFNALDTVNVSWISAHSRASLTLACHKNKNSDNNSNGAASAFTSALHLQVPATGCRLVSLAPASPYRTCRFQISAPANSSNIISFSASFDIITDEARSPVFRTLDPLASNHPLDGPKKCNGPQQQQQQQQQQGRKSAMVVGIGIGVGVAVGVVFAATLTLAAGTLLLLAVFSRRRRCKESGGGKAEEKEKEGSWIKGFWTREQ